MDHVVPVDEFVQQSEQSTIAPKKSLLPWKILCLVLALLVTLGWIGIIVVLILKDEWQLVLIAWLLLYAAAHFCYWYCRKNSSNTLSAQIRQQLAARIRGTEAVTGYETDSPPSYDELVKNEPPPPAYYSVVNETPKLKRSLASFGLPWFLKKKTLDQSAVDVAVHGKATTSVDNHGASTSTGESNIWKSSGSMRANVDITNFNIGDDDDIETIQLPSYETLMRQNVQPVMTPIHQALSALPSLPPPYSPSPMETIVEVEQQLE